MENSSGINFELYKIFYITASCGNITLAAEKLFLTQPSVTKHIRNLEEALGCTLFQRTKKGVTLTTEGQVLMRRIEPAYKLIRLAERQIRSLESLEEGTVSIASTEMSFKSYVLPAMIHFKKEHPNIKIRFANDLNDNIKRMLRDGVIDIAIIHEPFKKDDFMELRLIEHMEECLVCAQKYRFLSEKALTPQQILEYPFISMPKGSSTEEFLNRYFSSFGLDFHPEIELTTIELTIQAVESGLGISTLPRQIAEPLIRDGRMYRVPVAEPFPKRDVYLITNREMLPSIAVDSFINEILRDR